MNQALRRARKKAEQARKKTAQEIDQIRKETEQIRKEIEQRREEAEQRREEAKREAEREAERKKKENEEYERKWKEKSDMLNQQLSRLGNRFGEMIEYMVKPNLIAGFHELGFVFEKAYSDVTIKDKTNNIYAQIDIVLENGDKVMIVEIKSKLSTGDITEHVERMEKVKAHARLHGDRRTFLGAVGGMVIHDNEKVFAMKNGFYVIEPSGETFAITAPKGKYSPREW